MTAPKKNRARKRTAVAFCSAGAALFVAWIFFSGPSREERGWENYRAELAARGERLDWEDFIPPPVPDDENFFEAPGMRAWFDWQYQTTFGSPPIFQLPPWLDNSEQLTIEDLGETPNDGPKVIGSGGETVEDLREWFDRIEPEYQLLVNAAARPKARLNIDYHDFDAEDYFDIVTLGTIRSALAVKAQLDLLNNDSRSAIQSLLLMNQLGEIGGNHLTPINTILRTSILGQFAKVFSEGMEQGLFSAAEIAFIQESIRDVNLLENLRFQKEFSRANALRILSLPVKERVELLLGTNSFRLRNIVNADLSELYDDFKMRSKVSSEKWAARNRKALAEAYQEPLEAFDAENMRIFSGAINRRDFNEAYYLSNNENDLDAVNWLFLGSDLELVRVAQRQTQIDQLYVVCALERHRIEKGGYPESLEDLTSDYLDEIPGDLFSDDVLQYRNTGDGSFLLWSVGWDETDDDGTPVPDVSLDQIKDQKGDWVWGKSIMD